MFDIGWVELLIIAAVAILIVGPKDLPRAMRTVGNTVGKMRRMAGDFQRQFNDALREAELDDVKKSVAEIGRIDPLKDVKRAVEPAKKMGRDIQGEMDQTIKAANAPATARKAATPAPADKAPKAPPADKAPSRDAVAGAPQAGTAPQGEAATEKPAPRARAAATPKAATDAAEG